MKLVVHLIFTQAVAQPNGSLLARVEVMDYISLPFFLKQLHKRALFILFFHLRTKN